MKRSASPGLGMVAVFLVLAGLPAVYLSRCLFSSRVFLPADVLLLMDPWRAYVARDFPDFHRPHIPLLDPIQQYYPWRTYAAQSVHDGEIPLWNPFMFSGTPFVANFQSAVFYPPNVLYYLLPVPAAFEWSAAGALWIAEAGMYLFLGALGLSRVARLLGATAFAFSGFVTAWLPYLGPVNVYAWTPWALFFFERALSGKGRHPWAGLAAVLGIQFLAGHAQFSLYLLLVFVTYAIFRLVQMSRAGQPMRVPVTLTAGCLVLGAGLAALQLLPSLELAGLNYRTGALQYRDILPLPPAQLAHLLFPRALGSRTDLIDLNQELGMPNFVESCSYVGMAVFFLATLGLVASRSPGRLYFAGASLVALLLAFGSSLNWVTFHFVPGMKQLPNVGRALSVYAFSAAVLAALGTEALRSNLGGAPRASGRSRARPVHGSARGSAPLACRAAGKGVARVRGALAISVAGAICLSLFAWAYFRAGGLNEGLLSTPAAARVAEQIFPAIFRSLWLGLAVAAAAAGWIGGILGGKLPRTWGTAGLLALVAADLFVFGFDYYPASDPKILSLDMAAVRFLQAETEPNRMVSLGPPVLPDGSEHFLRRMSPNLPMAYGLCDIRGSESMYSLRYDRVLKALDLRPPYEAFADGRRHLIDLLNTRYVMTEMDLGYPGLRKVHQGDVNIYASSRATPRAFQVFRAETVGDQRAALDRVCASHFDPEASVVIEIVGAQGLAPLPGGSELPGAGLSCQPGRNATRVLGPLSSPAARQASGALPRALPWTDLARERPLARGASPSSWVVLSQAFYPGWKAFCDGREERTFAADGAVIAANVAGGRHVDFVYLPGSFAVGLFITLTSAGAWVGLAVWGRGKPPGQVGAPAPGPSTGVRAGARHSPAGLPASRRRPFGANDK